MNPTVRAYFYRVVDTPRRWLKRVVDSFVVVFTNPSKPLTPSEATNIVSLRRRIVPGDVLLICGNARISYVVKVLTLSAWSHVVLYVGDRSDLLTEAEKEEWTKRLGKESLKHLVIDADPVRKVHLKPLEDFAGMMLRHCRAEALDEDDTQQVIDHALAQLGRQYDIQHIIFLLIFFAIPWELFPQGLRRVATDFSLSEDNRICSRVLAEAFESVGYPISPLGVIHNRSAIHDRALGVAVGFKNRRKSAVKLMLGGRFKKAVTRLTDKRYTEIHIRSSRHITPADYDLSRFFAVIKDEDDLTIDYRKARNVCPLPWE